jgi:hypothetical protein
VTDAAEAVRVQRQLELELELQSVLPTANVPHHFEAHTYGISAFCAVCTKSLVWMLSYTVFVVVCSDHKGQTDSHWLKCPYCLSVGLPPAKPQVLEYVHASHVVLNSLLLPKSILRESTPLFSVNQPRCFPLHTNSKKILLSFIHVCTRLWYGCAPSVRVTRSIVSWLTKLHCAHSQVALWCCYAWVSSSLCRPKHPCTARFYEL